MIETFQIAQESWPEFFVAFSATNQGRTVGIEVVDEETGKEQIADAAPLLSVDYDPADKGNDIIIATGRNAIDYAHTVIAPTEVWQEQDENGNIVMIQIVDRGGGKTVLNVK